MMFCGQDRSNGPSKSRLMVENNPPGAGTRYRITGMRRFMLAAVFDEDSKKKLNGSAHDREGSISLKHIWLKSSASLITIQRRLLPSQSMISIATGHLPPFMIPALINPR